MIKRLILGDGLLGSYLQHVTGWDYISRKKDNIDLCKGYTYHKIAEDYDEIINCIASTDTYSEDKQKHWNVNYKALSELVDWCNKTNKKLIHISTDYIYSNSKENATEDDVPVHCANWYGYTKLLGDGYVQLKSKNYLLIRCTHKKTPFPYEYAFTNQKGNFDTIDKMVPLIADLIQKNATGIFNVGTEVKTMFELAKKTKPDVKPTNVFSHSTMPSNTTMSILKMTDFLSKNN